MVFCHMDRRLGSAAAITGLIAAVAVLGTPHAASAQTRTSLNTLFYSGVTNAGASAAQNVADLHYTLVGDPLGTVSTASPGSLYVTTKGSYAGRDNWLDDSAGNGVSRWLEPTSGTTTTHLPGTYTYRTTFDLSGFVASSAQLSLRMAVDDSVTVKVNETTVTGVTASSSAAFSSAATINNTNATFLSGVNTIDFVVTNGTGVTGNPVGLRVEASGTAITASAAPEPGALSLMAMGLVSAGGGSVALRKRRAQKA